MASNLSCIGLRVADASELDALLGGVLSKSTVAGTCDGVDVRRWEDASGARLIISVSGGHVLDLLPSFAGRPGVRVADCHPLNAEVAGAAVVDEDGEQITAMAFELEQRRALATRAPVAGTASVVAFGHAVTVHEDAAAFAASRSSLMDPDADVDQPAPPHIAERGLSWPLRYGANSFVSYGVFGEPENAEAQARLNGTVLAAERRRNSLTGTEFGVCRVNCLDFEVDVLLDAQDHPTLPTPGQVLAATPFLVASLDSVGFGAPAGPPAGPRRWWRWR